MKNKIIIKAVSLLLALCSLSGITACKKDDTQDYDENCHVEIITEEVKYSDAFIESASQKYLNIASAIAELSYGVAPDEELKEALASDFKSTLIPIFYRVKIYEEELDSILTKTEEYLTNNDNSLNPGFIFEFYQALVSVLNSEKSGALAYELALFTVNSNADEAKERYERYGFSWYLEDYNKYTDLYQSLVTLGRTKFVGAISVSSSITSLILGKTELSGNDILDITSSEFLFILDSQGQHFKDNSLTSEEWQVFGALISDFIPTKASDIYSSLLYALKKDDYITKAFAAMPEVVSLYASVAAKLKEEGIFRTDAAEQEQTAALISALLDCEEDIKKLDSSLSRYAKLDSARVKSAVEEYASREMLDSFFENTPPIGCDKLIAELKSIGDNPADTSSAMLKNTLASYICAYAPYLSYVIFN